MTFIVKLFIEKNILQLENLFKPLLDESGVVPSVGDE